MKPFRFRLARLLHLKQAEKKQCAAALAREQNELHKMETVLAEVRCHCTLIENSYGTLSTRVSNVREWSGAQLALEIAERHVATQVEAIRLAAQRVEDARDRLILKAREAETLERLRQRQWFDYNHERQREEQKENDAKAVDRFTRDQIDDTRFGEAVAAER